MSILIQLEAEARPGCIDQLTAMLVENLPDSCSFDGCEAISAHVDRAQPSRVLIVSMWESIPKYETYLQWRTERGDVGPMNELLVEPWKVRFLDDTGA